VFPEEGNLTCLCPVLGLTPYYFADEEQLPNVERVGWRVRVLGAVPDGRELAYAHLKTSAERWADGRFVLEQETNAYAVLPEKPVAGLQAATGAASALAGHNPPLGDRPPMLPAVAQAALEGDLAGKVQAR
jgi:hypothetical protein